jgi:Cu(I)/Ag(I) efflux system membrane protein CusA/SilA
VTDTQKAVAAGVVFPTGTYVTWSGQFEYLERAEARLKIVIPVTLPIIFLLLYQNFRTEGKAALERVSHRIAALGRPLFHAWGDQFG